MLVASVSAFAQTQPAQKHLAPVNHVTLTDRQVLHLDSAINVIAGMLDSKSATKYLTDAVKPIYDQVVAQMVVDTTKVVKPMPNKKP